MKRFLTSISLLTVTALLLISCSKGNVEEVVSGVIPEGEEGNVGEIPDNVSKADLGNMDFDFTDRDKKEDYDQNEVEDAEDNGETFNIVKEGTYIFSGDITDKMITVEVGDEEKVQIVLDNVNINNSNGPAVYIKAGDKVFITVKEGTENLLSCGEEAFIDGESEIDGAIFSRADLTINGKGRLTVNGNYKHGIVSKDDLNILDVTLNVTSKNVGLNGKDCVKINGAAIEVKAGSDGIRSDNEEDAERGFVFIESGSIKIVADHDGIQAETAVKIENGDFEITAGGGSTKTNYNSDESCKGIKAVSDVIINGGTFNINSLDDAIHSNNTICVSGGDFTLSTGDDGVHADTDLAIAAGKIKITKSYEGLEASRIFITGGSIDLTANDDGLNAAGGNDSSGTTGNPQFGGRPDMGGFSNGIGEIYISGGYTVVNASGDGIDSNGTISLSGGVVLVSGPTNNGNGSFDYDGSATVTGGVLVALGSSGMAQNFSNAENQGAILVSFTSQSANSTFAICGSDGKAIVSFTPPKAYQSAVITAPEIKEGETYTLYSGVTVEGANSNGYARNATVSGGTKLTEITMSSLIYGSGGMGGGPGGGGMQPPPGGGTRPQKPR